MRSFIRVLWCLVLVFLSMCGCGDSCDEQVKRAEEDCELRIGTLLRQKEVSDQCLKREAEAEAAAIVNEPEELPTCDKWVDSKCMEQDCPFDPAVKFPDRKFSEAEALQLAWHHVEYGVRGCRLELGTALGGDGRVAPFCSEWSEEFGYSREQVSERLDCLEEEYHTVNKRVLAFPRDGLPGNFAALGNTEGVFGFAPRLKAVQIYLDGLMDDDGRLETYGITPVELEAGFQKAFVEAWNFLAAAESAGDKGLADEITGNLCQIVSLDEQPYSMYPREPVKGQTRSQVEKTLKCPKAEPPKVEQQKAPSGGSEAHDLAPLQ